MQTVNHFATPQIAAPNPPIREQARRLRRWAKRKARGAGYATSQRMRKQIEELFGEAKDFMGLRRMRMRRLERVASSASVQQPARAPRPP